MSFKELVLISLIFVLGMVLVTLPFIMYFGMNHAIDDWIQGYFTVNLKHYSKSRSVFNSFVFVVKSFKKGLQRDFAFMIMCFIGLISLLVDHHISNLRFKRFLILIPFALLVLTVYIGGRAFIYYFLIFLPFVIFGIIGFLRGIELLFDKRIKKKSNFYFLIPVALSIILFITTLLTNHNIYMIPLKQKDFVQYSFAEIIKDSEGQKLLNYGCLDIGLFTTTGLIPMTKFFQKQNISYSNFPENMDEQKRYVNEKMIEFIVTKELEGLRNDSINVEHRFNGYKLVAMQNQKYEGRNYLYYLFKLKK